MTLQELRYFVDPVVIRKIRDHLKEKGEYRMSIEFVTTLFPQLDEMGEYRSLTSLSWANKLNATMRLKVGLTNEYDSNVGEDVKHNDFTYTTSLSWDI